jgi:pimeloyl-ACP methyl ester carboxylesterase
VPGTTSTLAGAAGDLGRAQALYDTAPGQMASVYWLGYDAPDWPPPMGHDPDYGPANQKYADVGGPLLAAFVNSLNAQHQGPTNVTMIGHSYGSTVVGDALANYGLHAQGAIFVGSPGVVADTASGLHLDPGRVWPARCSSTRCPRPRRP